MRKIYNLLKEGSGAMIFGVACASIGSACFLPGMGIVNTFPFVALFTLIPALIAKKSYHLPIMFFAVTYLYSFALEAPSKYPELWCGYALYISLFAFAISAITCVACYLIKEAYRNPKRRIAYAIASAALLIITVLGNTWLNGTPWEHLDAKAEISSYAESNFIEQELNVHSVYYVQSKDYYACDVYVATSGTEGSFVCTNEGVTTDLNDDAVYFAGVDKMTRITQLLRKLFPDDNFTVSPNIRSFEGLKFSFAKPEELSHLISYTVTINSEETAKSFVRKAETYIAALSNSSIDCGRITVNGGAKQKLYYTLTVDTTAPHAELSSFLRIYSNYPLPQESVLSAIASTNK